MTHISSLDFGIAASRDRPHVHDDPIRPHLAQYTHIQLGELVCTGIGPGCAGPISGSMQGWWQFDEQGWFSHYREDAVLGDTFFVYNREYATPTSSYEYYLLNQTSINFICTTLPVGTSFHREFLNATYVGVGKLNDIDVWIWKDIWIIQGVPSPCQVYVNIANGRMYGWSLAAVNGVSYVYHRWIESKPFVDALFTRPDVPCVAPPSPAVE